MGVRSDVLKFDVNSTPCLPLVKGLGVLYAYIAKADTCEVRIGWVG